MAAGKFARKVIMFMVTVIIVGALIGPLTTALDNYAANDTTFGTVLKTVSLILIGVGLLLYAVHEFLPGVAGRRGD